MILLHGFIKKSQKTSPEDLQLARERLSRLRGSEVNKKYIGSNFDDFLQEEGLLTDAEAVAVKRVIAFQVARLMEEQNITKSEMSRRMKTSRASLERLLDPSNGAVTLQTLDRAARALGRRLQIGLV